MAGARISTDPKDGLGQKCLLKPVSGWERVSACNFPRQVHRKLKKNFYADSTECVSSMNKASINAPLNHDEIGE